MKIIILQSLLNLYSGVRFQFAFWVILRHKILAEKCPPEKNTLFESRTLAVLFQKKKVPFVLFGPFSVWEAWVRMPTNRVSA